MIKVDNLSCRAGVNIWQIRKKMHITQLGLAGRVGMTAAHLCNIEKGKRGISLATLDSIAEVLRVSPAALLK